MIDSISQMEPISKAAMHKQGYYSLILPSLLYKWHYHSAAGENRIPLDLKDLPSGVYYLSVTVGDRVERVRFNHVK